MASPLAPYTNAVFILRRPIANSHIGRLSAANGYRRAAGDPDMAQFIFVYAFLKRSSGQQGPAHQHDDNVAISHDILSGYTIRWQSIYAPQNIVWPSGWRDPDFGPGHPEWPAGLGEPYQGSQGRALSPSVSRGLRIELLAFSDDRIENAILQEWSGPYGDEGIGGLVRGILGDPITIRIEQRT